MIAVSASRSNVVASAFSAVVSSEVSVNGSIQAILGAENVIVQIVQVLVVLKMTEVHGLG